MSKKIFFHEPTSADLDQQILTQAAGHLVGLRTTHHREKLKFFWQSFAGLALATGAIAWLWRSQKTTTEDSITLLSFVPYESEIVEDSLVLTELELDQEPESARDELFDDFEFLVGISEEDWQQELLSSNKKESS